MKFSVILAIASVAVAAPPTSLEKRWWQTDSQPTCWGAPCEQQTTDGSTSSQQTGADVILNASKTLESAVLANSDTINTALDTIKSNIYAAAQLIVVVNANYQAIGDALKVAAANVASVTTLALGGIALSAKGYTDAQIQQLTEGLTRTVNAIKAIRATIVLTYSNLTPGLIATIQYELIAAQNAVALLITPLAMFACAVGKAAPPELSVSVLGLGNALSSLLSVVQGLFASLGLPTLNIAGTTDFLLSIKTDLKLPLPGY